MKRNLTARLTALLLAALFALAQLVPATPAQAQRRRRRAARPAPARRSNPQAPQRAGGPATRAETPTPSAPARRAGKETAFESLLAEDAYGVFIEVRKIGQLSQNDDLKTALAALRLSGEMPKEIGDLLAFINQQAEALAEARYVLTMMPAMPGLPVSLSALEFPTVEAAAAFEPKYRALVNEQMKAYKKAATPPARGVPRMPEINLDIRRVGNVMLLGTERFTLKQLRGDGTARLSESVRFQTMRGRFASESLFVYVDTGAVQRGWAAQMEVIKKQVEEEQAAAQAAGASDPDAVGTTQDPRMAGSLTVEPTGPGTREGTLTMEAAVTSATPAPETAEAEEGEGDGEGEEEELTPEEIALIKAREEAAAEPPKPSEEQVAVGHFTSLLRGWEGGSPRIPETFAVAVALEGGTVVARAAVANTPDGAVNLIPFLPNVFNGPPVTSESATLAPADTDVFFSTSLEWSRIFNGLLASADEQAARMQTAMAENPEAMEGNHAMMPPAVGGDGKPLTPGAVVETIEKLFGFKFKEDLLPSLGNEVAFSVPLSFFTSNRMSEQAKKEEVEKEKEEKAARPGFVVLVALNDADKVRKILPRVAVAFGMAAPGAPAQTERREGFDIQSLGSFSYVIINNHLAVAEDVRAVRHVVDSFSRRQTLDAASKFRDATSWQAKQRVAQVFVADSMMKYAQDDARKTASLSADPLVAAIASQLDSTPEPAAYAATNEGDAILHEVRLPLNLIKTYAASIMISAKEAPVRGNESMARYALTGIASAQERFKVEKGMQRYGTLEELVKEDLVEKWILERQEYKIEVTVVGDRFEATAVPMNYGKTGRRSFFVDESGVVRAADHQGKPATVEDPPVDGEP
jgi:hypothetical protein